MSRSIFHSFQFSPIRIIFWANFYTNTLERNYFSSFIKIKLGCEGGKIWKVVNVICISIYIIWISFSFDIMDQIYRLACNLWPEFKQIILTLTHSPWQFFTGTRLQNMQARPNKWKSHFSKQIWSFKGKLYNGRTVDMAYLRGWASRAVAPPPNVCKK